MPIMEPDSDAPMLSDAAQEAFAHVKKEMMDLNHVFVQDKFTMGQLGSDNAKYFFSVRDSIIYRSNSLMWHTSQLSSIHADLELQLHSSFLAGMHSAELLPSHQAGLHYLFDDIVFGNVSLLDTNGIVPLSLLLRITVHFQAVKLAVYLDRLIKTG